MKTEKRTGHPGLLLHGSLRSRPHSVTIHSPQAGHENKSPRPESPQLFQEENHQSTDMEPRLSLLWAQERVIQMPAPSGANTPLHFPRFLSTPKLSLTSLLPPQPTRLPACRALMLREVPWPLMPQQALLGSSHERERGEWAVGAQDGDKKPLMCELPCSSVFIPPPPPPCLWNIQEAE